MQLSTHLMRVLKKYPYKKLLIALSGGPDSMSLLYLLLEVQKELALDIAVAHVDHGWRVESGQEAESLKKTIHSLGLPFFLHAIHPAMLQGNLEEASREERFRFFTTICCNYGYDAVVLAHHADDQAETVLKRCLEGASIYSIHGMREQNKREDLIILRPLLGITKKEIMDYLNQQGRSYLTDPTNNDLRFLRGRMRQAIFPVIDREFGKSSQQPLNRLAQESLELKNYVKERIAALKIPILKAEWGICLDMRGISHFLETKWMISHVLKQEGVMHRHALINQMAESLSSGQANKKFSIQNRWIYCDRGHLFLLNKSFFDQLESKSCDENQEIRSGTWKIKVETFKRNETEVLGWKNAFLGHCKAILPEGTYTIDFPKQPFWRSLDSLWGKMKVPAFLRNQVPVLYNSEGSVVHEFLSGKKLIKHASGENGVMVSLYRE